MGQYGLDDLKLAFSMHVIDQIVTADARLTREEVAFLEARFPNHVLVERGFATEDGVRTDAYHDCAMQALEQLPEALDSSEKGELLEVFFAATIVDDDFEISEGNALVDAARLLDLTDTEIDGFLATRKEVGNTRVAELDAHPDDP